MTDDERSKSPAQAHEEGLEQIEHERHHPTTGHDKPPHLPARPIVESPGDVHRGGPLPNQKR